MGISLNGHKMSQGTLRSNVRSVPWLFSSLFIHIQHHAGLEVSLVTGDFFNQSPDTRQFTSFQVPTSRR